MNNQYKIARLGSMSVYVFVCISTICLELIMNRLSTPLTIGTVIYAVVSIIVLSRISKSTKIHENVYKYMQSIFYLIISMGFCTCIGNREAIIALISSQIILNLIFFDRNLCLIETIFQLVILTIVSFMPSDYFNDILSLPIFCAYLVGVLFQMWISLIIIMYIKKNLTANHEQEESLDDLLKIVEVKCVEARKTAKLRSTFLTNISYEIKKPLNAILGMNDLILRDGDNQQVIDHAHNIEEMGKELLNKINEILDYSRLDAGSMELVEKEYHFIQLLNDIKTLGSTMAQKKNLEFSIIADENLPSELKGDATRIRQVVMNLVTNAVKYTEKGQVKVVVSGESKSSDRIGLCIKVEDTGRGIDEKDFESIFIPFGKENSEEDLDGAGIGLATTKEYLNLMNGKITVESSLGNGSVFSVMFPQVVVSNDPIGEFDKTNEEKQEEKANEEKGNPYDNIRMLVVDDVSINLKMFAGLLKNTGAIVDQANSGQKCIDLVKENQYDFIFLDHMMPEMDGVETLNHIKELPAFNQSKTVVIALTANTESGAKEEYVNLGFDDYASKPIKKDALYELINHYIENAGSKNTVSDSDEAEAKPFTLSDLNFLNTEEGLRICGGDENLFLEIVNEYAVNDKLKEMDSFFQKKDWKNYEILVHALKSTSKSIGADQLSDSAKELEFAAKNNEINFILDNHAKVYGDYKDLLMKINAVSGRTSQVADDEDNDETKYLVYVVDDDVVNLKIAEGILKKYFATKVFSKGLDFLAAMEQVQPNLILLDIMMPDYSGFDLIKIIKEREEWKEIPVIFLTADDDIETEIKGFKCGALDFIRKPFAPEIVLERINRMIELNQLRSYLESEVERKTGKVEKLSLQAMTTLAMTIDAKDKYTNGHSTRVAKYSAEIAKRYGFSAVDQQTIYYMGLLHDIGKIGVPDTIINKDGKLTDEEFGMIKKHPEIGYGILKNITEIPDIEKGARWHHERYDGRGYPDGLKGEEIPLFARIIAVADSYDAMTSKRSYRDVLPQDYVRNEVEKCKGTQFDPNVADIMLQMIDEDKSYSMKEV